MQRFVCKEMELPGADYLFEDAVALTGQRLDTGIEIESAPNAYPEALLRNDYAALGFLELQNLIRARIGLVTRGRNAEDCFYRERPLSVINKHVAHINSRAGLGVIRADRPAVLAHEPRDRFVNIEAVGDGFRDALAALPNLYESVKMLMEYDDLLKDRRVDDYAQLVVWTEYLGFFNPSPSAFKRGDALLLETNRNEDNERIVLFSHEVRALRDVGQTATFVRHIGDTTYFEALSREPRVDIERPSLIRLRMFSVERATSHKTTPDSR